MLLCISLRGLAIRVFFVVVPTSGSTTDDESVGLDQEHQGPEQEENMEAEEHLQPGSDMEMSEWILMRSGVGRSQGVESQSLKHPNHQEDHHNNEKKNRQKNNCAMLGNEVSSNLDNTGSQGNSSSETNNDEQDDECQDEANYSCNDRASSS